MLSFHQSKEQEYIIVCVQYTTVFHRYCIVKLIFSNSNSFLLQCIKYKKCFARNCHSFVCVVRGGKRKMIKLGAKRRRARAGMHEKNTRIFHTQCNIFHTPHFPHSIFSILNIFHTQHFLHSTFSTLTFSTLTFSTLIIFHTQHFLHSTFSTQNVFHTNIIHTQHFPHSSSSTLIIFHTHYSKDTRPR